MWHKIKIDGFPDGRIEINDNLQVRNPRTGNILKPTLVGSNRATYLGFSVYYNKQRKNKLYHRAIAETFIPNPENKQEVNHIDGNKHNNTLTNLEWVTRTENINHAIQLGLYDPKKKTEAKTKQGIKIGKQKRKLTFDQAEEIKKLPSTLTHSQVAKMYGVSRYIISGIRRNKWYVTP